MPCVPPSFYSLALANFFVKKKSSHCYFFFISQGELNVQLHILNERRKKSVLNEPFIGGAKWKVWNLASRKYQDPLEAGMKSLSLASQLCVSIHNPAPKPQRRTADTPMAWPMQIYGVQLRALLS